MGVKIFEKHFTLDNNFQNFTDHKVSMNPKDFNNYVNDINKAFETLGHPIRKNYTTEKDVYVNNRRSVYAAKDIKKGELLDGKIKFLRPFSSRSFNINNLKNKKSLKKFQKK